MIRGIVLLAAFAATAPMFFDVAEKAGVKVHIISGDPAAKKYLIEAMGGGVAAFDYDNDGLMDLYVVNGSTIPETRAGKHSQRSALFRNRGDGTFQDVTIAAGVPNRGWGMGALAADLNGDGYQDLYITNFGPNVLYINNGDGTFRDATAKAGVGDPRWSSSAAAADYDKDGDLDIFVVNYLDYDLKNLPAAGKFCSYQNISVSCGPRGLKGAGDTLYRNNGDGTFTDVSAKAGVQDEDLYYGLGTVWGDYDNDGDADLFVANDNTPNYLYRNNGEGTFTDVAIEAGVAFSEDGREQAGMGVEFEDLDNDGFLDIMVTNFSDDYTTLYRNTGKGFFRDESQRAGLVAQTWRDLSWGVGFFDFNNDGWKDVFIASGHIYPQVDGAGVNTTYRQRNKLFLNQDGSKLTFNESGLTKAKSYRGAAFADFNNDGAMDVAVSAIDDSPSLLINEPPKGSWIMVKLAGKGSNRDAIGGRVMVTAAGRTQVREIKAGGSYASTNDKRAHFGLANATVVDELIVRWPSGEITRLANLKARQIIAVSQ